MKILHINGIYRPLGGTEKYLLDTCKALEKRGHEVVVISSSQRSHISVPGRKEYFIENHKLYPGLNTTRRIKKTILLENPDVVHLHNVRYFLSPYAIHIIHKLKPAVKTVHDVTLFCLNEPEEMKVIPPLNQICNFAIGINCFKKQCYFLEHKNGFIGILKLLRNITTIFGELRVTRKLDKLIVGSRYMYKELLRNSFPGENIELLPLYTDRMQISDREPFVDEDIILWVGRFDYSKGIIQFIESLNLIQSKKWKTVVVGDGKQQNDVINLINNFKLNDKIEFAGRLSPEKLNAYYQKCTLVVMSSMVPESFGLVGIEAMVFGKPVVAFNSGGISEWLVDNETGFLVNRGDVNKLANCIDKLLNNKELAAKLGNAGKKRVEKLYRKDKHISRLVEIYKEVIEKRRTSNANYGLSNTSHYPSEFIFENGE